MAVKINWVHDNPGAARDESGYWTSMEGRFNIAPRYRHTVNPDSYELTDRFNPAARRSFDTVREAKAYALMALLVKKGD